MSELREALQNLFDDVRIHAPGFFGKRESFKFAKALLARPEPKPFCWVIPGDTANDMGFIDALANREGEFTKPLYAVPAAAEKARELFTLDEWTEKDGDVLWWKFPIDEPPYVGSPLCSDWPWDEDEEGDHVDHYTHWTRIPLPSPPAATGETSTPILDEPDPEETSDDTPRAMDFIPPHLSGGCS